MFAENAERQQVKYMIQMGEDMQGVAGYRIALVTSFESANTAIEAAVDLVPPDIHPLAKKAKDCASCAALLASIGSAVVGGMVFVSKLLNVFTSDAA